MATLPPGWAADYDGRRWFFQYAATGHVQYHFPTAGDEFPDFAGFFGGSGGDSGGAGSTGPAAAELLPEERLESERQVRRRATLENNDGGGGGGSGGQRCSPSFAAAAAVGDDGDGDGDGDEDEDGGGMCRFESFGYLGPGCHGSRGGVSPAAAAKGSVRGNAGWPEGSLASAGGMSSLTPPPSAGAVGILPPHQLVDEARNVAPAEKEEEEDEGEGRQGRPTYLPQPPPPLPAKVRLVTPTETDRSTLSRAAFGGDNDDQRGPSPPPLEVPMLDGRAIPATSPVGRVAELPSAPAAHRAEEEASPAAVELPGSGASWLEPVPVPVPDPVDQQHPVELPARAGEGGGGGPATLKIPRGGGAKDDEEEDRDDDEERLHQEILGFFPARKNEEIPRALQIGVPKPASERRKSAPTSEGRRLGPVPSILRPGPRRSSQQQPPTVVAARAGVVAGTQTTSPSSSPPRHHSEVTYQAFRPARPPMVAGAGGGGGGGGGRTQSSPDVDRSYTASERAPQPHHHHHHHHCQEPAQAMGRPHAQSVGAKHYDPLPRDPGVAFMPDPSNHVSPAPML